MVTFVHKDGLVPGEDTVTGQADILTAPPAIIPANTDPVGMHLLIVTDTTGNSHTLQDVLAALE